MNTAIKKALEVLRTFGLLSLSPDFQHISTIIDKENIIFTTFPFKGRLKERYICTNDGIALITVDNFLNPVEIKHLTAHALGHHYLHKGSYAFINNIVLDKQEYQAEEFAAVLLVPPSVLQKIKPATAYELAEECDIPVHLAERRLRIYEKYGV